jgi:hypothetical protein
MLSRSGCQKLGQPVPLSYLVLELNSGRKQAAQRKVPDRFSWLSGLLPARSVPASNRMWYCSGRSRGRQYAAGWPSSPSPGAGAARPQAGSHGRLARAARRKEKSRRFMAGPRGCRGLDCGTGAAVLRPRLLAATGAVAAEAAPTPTSTCRARSTRRRNDCGSTRSTRPRRGAGAPPCGDATAGGRGKLRQADFDLSRSISA